MLYFYIAAGGAFGAVCRYLLSTYVTSLFGKEFPYGTLTVNVIGALLMGIAIGIITGMLPKGREFHALIVIGALGGFTTFSAFTFETYMLIERGEYASAAIYIAGSVAISLAALFLGMWMYKVAT